MTETEIKQYIISNQICTASELMSECALTYDELAAITQNDIDRYKAIAEKCGITEFRRPLIWSEIIPMCHDKMTLNRIGLLVWLMTGGSFETSDMELVINQWIFSTQRETEIINWLQEVKYKNQTFSDIMRKLHTGEMESDKMDESYLKIYRIRKSYQANLL